MRHYNYPTNQLYLNTHYTLLTITKDLRDSWGILPLRPSSCRLHQMDIPLHKEPRSATLQSQLRGTWRIRNEHRSHMSHRYIYIIYESYMIYIIYHINIYYMCYLFNIGRESMPRVTTHNKYSPWSMVIFFWEILDDLQKSTTTKTIYNSNSSDKCTHCRQDLGNGCWWSLGNRIVCPAGRVLPIQSTTFLSSCPIQFLKEELLALPWDVTWCKCDQRWSLLSMLLPCLGW